MEKDDSEEETISGLGYHARTQWIDTGPSLSAAAHGSSSTLYWQGPSGTAFKSLPRFYQALSLFKSDGWWN
jgi:hypothetical protein